MGRMRGGGGGGHHAPTTPRGTPQPHNPTLHTFCAQPAKLGAYDVRCICRGCMMHHARAHRIFDKGAEAGNVIIDPDGPYASIEEDVKVWGRLGWGAGGLKGASRAGHLLPRWPRCRCTSWVTDQLAAPTRCPPPPSTPAEGHLRVRGLLPADGGACRAAPGGRGAVPQPHHPLLRWCMFGTCAPATPHTWPPAGFTCCHSAWGEGQILLPASAVLAAPPCCQPTCPPVP
jgi:hypothetical protein